MSARAGSTENAIVTEGYRYQPETRTRRERRHGIGCEVCGRPIYGDGRLCKGPVNAAAPSGCFVWVWRICAMDIVQRGH